MLFLNDTRMMLKWWNNIWKIPKCWNWNMLKGQSVIQYHNKFAMFYWLKGKGLTLIYSFRNICNILFLCFVCCASRDCLPDFLYCRWCNEVCGQPSTIMPRWKTELNKNMIIYIFSIISIFSSFLFLVLM